jgi:glycosyltransferase involved in cell wall biosynthesis
MQKPLLLCFYVHRSSFVARDIDMLAPYYRIQEFDFAVRRKWHLPLVVLKQLLFLMKYRSSAIASLTIIGGYVSFLPSLFDRFFGLRSIIILGGTDCTRFPAIGYGNFSRKLLGFFTCLSMRWSSHLAPVFQSLVSSEYTYDAMGAPNQGFRHFCKGVETPVTEIWNGFSSEDWPFNEGPRPKMHFITIIAGLESYRTYMLKGVDLIVEMARHFPDASFTIVGTPHRPVWISEDVKNIHFHPKTDRYGLIALLHEHRFYLQLSLSEGFPNALCEAMLCGCIPIGSNVASIPFIIGDTGYVLQQKNVPHLVELTTQAIRDQSKEERNARERIKSVFTLDQRKEQLLALINSTSK